MRDPLENETPFMIVFMSIFIGHDQRRTVPNADLKSQPPKIVNLFTMIIVAVLNLRI